MCTSIHMCLEARRESTNPGIDVTHSCKTMFEYWEMTSGSLHEHNSFFFLSASTVLGTFPTDSVLLFYVHLRTLETENYDMGIWTKCVSSATGTNILIAKLFLPSIKLVVKI